MRGCSLQGRSDLRVKRQALEPGSLRFKSWLCHLLIWDHGQITKLLCALVSFSEKWDDGHTFFRVIMRKSICCRVNIWCCWWLLLMDGQLRGSEHSDGGGGGKNRTLGVSLSQPPVQQRVMLHAYTSRHWWIWESKVCTPTLPPSLLGGDSESEKKEEAFQRRENLDLMATELHCRDGRADSSWIDPELISMGCLRRHCKNFKCISHI